MNETTLKLVAGEIYEGGLHHEGCICDECLAAMVEDVTDEPEAVTDEPIELRMLRLGMTDGTFGG